MDKTEYRSTREAFTAAQAEFPRIQKDKEVSFGRTRFRYASLDAIYAGCRPVLNKHGLSVSHELRPREDFLMVTTIIQSAGPDSEILESAIPIAFRERAMKDIGAEITYAKRYTLSSLLGVAADEDLDAAGMAGTPRTGRQRPAGRPSIKDMARSRPERSEGPQRLQEKYPDLSPDSETDENVLEVINRARDAAGMNVALAAVNTRPEIERSLYRETMIVAANRSGAEYDSALGEYVRIPGSD